MNTIWAKNVPDAYAEAITKMHIWGEEEDSRNGPVITSPDPVYLEIRNPRQRVLFDPVRDCNPFFHVMEFVWMVAGEDDVRWIEQFNKGFRAYVDPGTNFLHGAYGKRWIHHFGTNQIRRVAEMLKADPTTRRAVISMWDSRVDLDSHADLPCNTQIMFRYTEGMLDMTVINRSNDLIWGMLGANAVHMTYLHELVAFMAEIPLGMYRVFTNNLHVYKNMPRFEDIWATRERLDLYSEKSCRPIELLYVSETYNDLFIDCYNLIHGVKDNPRTNWMAWVAKPMCQAYCERLLGGDGLEHVDKIGAPDWKIACIQYTQRREMQK